MMSTTNKNTNNNQTNKNSNTKIAKGKEDNNAQDNKRSNSNSVSSFVLSPAFLVAIGLRVLLFLWNFDQILGTRKEIVTPVTDFKRGILFTVAATTLLKPPLNYYFYLF